MGFICVLVLLFFVFASCRPQPEKVKGDNTNALPDNMLKLSEAQIQLANIRVVQVNEADFQYDRLFTGVLKVNEESAVNISSRTTGRIIKLFYKNAGETVNKGDSLYQFFSEELVAAEREYFTLQSNNWNFNGKYEPSLALENKLMLLGMLPSQVEKLRKDGKIFFSTTICSPVKGIIRSINVTEGEYVTKGQTLFEMADDSRLWVEAQVNPGDMDFLRVGMRAKITLPDAGNKIVESKISFINPSLEQNRYVVVVRADIDNAKKEFHPGMLAFMRVQTQKSSCVVVPSSAVITDKKGSLVWIQNYDGTFSAKSVTTGIQSEDSVQIISGLNASEYVVVSGSYLLNSEMILRKGNATEIVENMQQSDMLSEKAISK